MFGIHKEVKVLDMKLVFQNCSLIIITSTVHHFQVMDIRYCPYLITLLNISNAVGPVLSSLSSLLAPREMKNGYQEETVASVRNTGQHVPPSDECSNNAEGTTCDVEIMVGRGDAINGCGVHVAGGEHEEGNPHREEEGGESDGRSEGKQPEDEGKNEPALHMVSVGVLKTNTRRNHEHT